jgi:phosphoribosylanthranilate isomerase
VQSRATLQAAGAFHTDFLLLDAHVEGVPGGTGRTIDWQLVRGAKLVPPVILSGGLTPDNVTAAIAATEPYAVDVASGTEAAPGVKDPAKLAAFGDAVRAADEASAEQATVSAAPAPGSAR